ncbi:hypothetical protein NP234_24955, partial [Salmonella enterica]|nr:hypothetical protein [Salmonella enterica]
YDKYLGDGTDETVYADGSDIVYTLNFICDMKKGDILYYTDLSGSSTSGKFEENEMSLSVDSIWNVKMCYFDERPTRQPIPNGSSQLFITRKYLKYYRASGEVGNLNEDYFLGNVANNMWLMAYEDSYVMFAGRFRMPYDDGFVVANGISQLKKFRHPFAIQHIGHFNSFELYPSDGVHSSFASWVKGQKFSSESSPAEVIFKLSNDISCHAVDSYGRTINLDCPQFCWSVDLQKGTATYTPYFAPKQGASYMLTGDPQLCNLTESAPTNKTFLLWGDDAGDKTTSLNGANVSTLSVSGGMGSVTLSGISETAQVFSLSGVKVLSVADDGKYALAPGVYVVQ